MTQPQKQQPTIEELENQLEALAPGQAKEALQEVLSHEADNDIENLNLYPITDAERLEYQEARSEWDAAKVKYEYQRVGTIEEWAPQNRVLKKMLAYIAAIPTKSK